MVFASGTASVFRTLSSVTGPYLLRLPDGETWIRFLQGVLAENPAIERADEILELPAATEASGLNAE